VPGSEPFQAAKRDTLLAAMGSPPIVREEIDPSSPAWQKYYAEAARRRRAQRKLRTRSLSETRKHQKRIEATLLVGSIALLGILTLIFHAVLTR
jgi:hypothetical protein